MKRSTDKLVIGALIAAVYAGLTYFSNIFGLAYGPIQFRVSEALTVLPVFGTAAIPGLAVGCFLANIASFNPIDLVFGTSATLLSAMLSYAFRNIKVCKLPLVSIIMPVIVNALIIGGEISVFFTTGDATGITFFASALYVALGEFAVCLGLGIPLYFAVLKKEFLLKKI